MVDFLNDQQATPSVYHSCVFYLSSKNDGYFYCCLLGSQMYENLASVVIFKENLYPSPDSDSDSDPDLKIDSGLGSDYRPGFGLTTTLNLAYFHY